MTKITDRKYLPSTLLRTFLVPYSTSSYLAFSLPKNRCNKKMFRQRGSNQRPLDPENRTLSTVLAGLTDGSDFFTVLNTILTGRHTC